MRKWLALPFVGVLVFAAWRTAWMADDAYITFRVADNWISGFGPRWNVHERVQAFTNPLWMIVSTIAMTFTREAFVTLTVLQIALTLVCGIMVLRNARTPLGGALGLAVLCMSRAFVDFSASGMENTLAHVIAIAWAHSVLKNGRRDTLLGALLLVTRLDFLWLIVPRLFERRRHFPILSLWPFFAWELFAFVYYGSFLPNSARAKLTSGIAEARLMKSGLAYVLDSLRIDPLTLVAIACAIVLARRRSIALGLLLTVAYVVFVGGDFMSGRFFSVPLAVSAVVIADRRWSVATFSIAGAALVALAAKAGFPTLTDRFQAIPDAQQPIVDCRLAFHPFTGFTVNRPPEMYPEFVRFGKSTGVIGRPIVLPAIGIAGYYGGPNARIVDAFALSDPLRARLPIPDAAHETTIKMGHFMRPVPDGWLATIETGKNQLRHPALHAYYDSIELVTRGPIFQPKRLWTALMLELGQYDDLRAQYLVTYDEKLVQLSSIPPNGTPRETIPPGFQCYSWWRPCAENGYTFTKTGIRVMFMRTGAPRFTIDATPGDYKVIFRDGEDEIARSEIAIGGKSTFDVPEDARAGFDTLVIFPKKSGSRTVTFLTVP